MGRLVNLLLLVFIVQFVMIMLHTPDVTGTKLYTFMMNPTDFGTDTFKLIFTDLLGAIGAVSFFLGLYVFKSDFVVFAGAVSILISFGIPLAELWSLINANINGIVASLIVSPIALLYIITLSEWWRSSR